MIGETQIAQFKDGSSVGEHLSLRKRVSTKDWLLAHAGFSKRDIPHH
jgi:hypothetical protein